MLTDLFRQMMYQININEAVAVLKPLAYFILGMAVYSIFIFKFYRFVAKKDIFELNFKKYDSSRFPVFSKVIHSVFYFFKYTLVFPVYSFFWFGVLTFLLTFLSKSTSVENILLTSMALVGAVRVTSYYDEDLSKDLAKMLPFALLGVFLIDISFFSISSSLDKLWEIPSKYLLLSYYLAFSIVLEFVLRILSWIFALFVAKEGKK